MQPDLEIVQVRGDESFTVWAHGYPYRTVRWHFHPEYELHLVVETHGVFFVGDHIGHFAPGQLVLVGPDLPHNWISDVPEGQTVERRGIVVQFPAAFVQGLENGFPEYRRLGALLADARCGVEFSPGTAQRARPMMETLLEATGMRRMAVMLELLALLYDSNGRTCLSSADFRPETPTPASAPQTFNHVLLHISDHLGQDLHEPELAALVGQSPSAFSRMFRKHTGQPFVRYVNRLRIGRACELLASTDRPVLDVCVEVGFNNVSNFNRQFRLHKGMSPTQFRSFHRMQYATALNAGFAPGGQVLGGSVTECDDELAAARGVGGAHAHVDADADVHADAARTANRIVEL